WFGWSGCGLRSRAVAVARGVHAVQVIAFALVLDVRDLGRVQPGAHDGDDAAGEEALLQLEGDPVDVERGVAADTTALVDSKRTAKDVLRDALLGGIALLAGPDGAGSASEEPAVR